MQLLDTILAFALTMAALATVVTVIIEAGLRIARMRKKNFIEVMKLLNKELDKGALGEKGALRMSAAERWDFLVRVVNNPAEAAFDKIKPELDELTLEGRLDYFGRDKAAGVNPLGRVWNFVTQLFGDKKRACLYEGVSLEYLLRCLVDTPSVKKASRTASETLKVEFNRLARKYEEFGSSVSASFKHHSQGWSIGVGILLAIFVNINGIRIFDAYRADPSLANAVIEKQEILIENHEKAQASVDDFKKAAAVFDKAKNELEKAQAKGDPGKIEKAKTVKDAAEKVLEEKTSLKEIQAKIQGAQQQIADLVTIGVPIGWDFYPHCPYGGKKSDWEKSSPKCRDIPIASRSLGSKCPFFRIMNTLWVDWPRFIIWFIVVVISGILIGLGAPFWFDVAKRLSQIRKGLQKASASKEYRLSGRDADGSFKRRKEIVAETVEQAMAEEKHTPAGTTKGRPLLSPDGTTSR